MLNKIVTVFLLVIYLLSATASQELLKIPGMVSHYYCHQLKNSNTDLFQFLLSHYCIEDGTDSDANEDKQLPFKSSEHAMFLSFVSLTPPLLVTEVATRVTEFKISFFIRKDLFLPSQYLSSIWQPPRKC